MSLSENLNGIYRTAGVGVLAAASVLGGCEGSEIRLGVEQVQQKIVEGVIDSALGESDGDLIRSELEEVGDEARDCPGVLGAKIDANGNPVVFEVAEGQNLIETEDCVEEAVVEANVQEDLEGVLSGTNGRVRVFIQGDSVVVGVFE